MKWIYIVTWCIMTIAPKAIEIDKFGRINPSVTDELNYDMTCWHEKKFAFKEDALKFYEEALNENGLRRVTLDSCNRQMEIIYGDTVWVDCWEFDHSLFQMPNITLD